ncbi:hypothetical protein IFM89_028294 [Coptis chinensis]|uniref:Reverse transcriptase zinc-binding domain-containing protein n=1 Tax=Coptis chinensis TaxID=261450 RepID=A0A835HDS3_9MAGN|nr:hypothetical protein IFM89_028294 [Coptis chinensis]
MILGSPGGDCSFEGPFLIARKTGPEFSVAGKTKQSIMLGTWQVGNDMQLVLDMACISHNDLPKIQYKGDKEWWWPIVWKHAVHRRLSTLAWIYNYRVPIDSLVQQRGINMASRCYLCQKDNDDLQHLIWECSLSSQLYMVLAMLSF